MNQITQYHPPPNPAKMTDSRAEDYVAEFGDESWELDALEPAVIAALIRQAVENVRDEDYWDDMREKEKKHRENIQDVSNRWDDIVNGS